MNIKPGSNTGTDSAGAAGCRLPTLPLPSALGKKTCNDEQHSSWLLDVSEGREVRVGNQSGGWLAAAPERATCSKARHTQSSAGCSVPRSTDRGHCCAPAYGPRSFMLRAAIVTRSAALPAAGGGAATMDSVTPTSTDTK